MFGIGSFELLFVATIGLLVVTVIVVALVLTTTRRK